LLWVAALQASGEEGRLVTNTQLVYLNSVFASKGEEDILQAISIVPVMTAIVGVAVGREEIVLLY
jgi:hypothetical protein